MNEIDDYMDIAPDDPSFDIEKIIAHHRKYRSQIEGGTKPKRAKKDTGPKVESDFDAEAFLKTLIKSPATPTPPSDGGFKRRI